MIVVNGTLKDQDTIVLDDGYAFGKGFFETIHVAGRPLFLEEHVARINKSLEAFGFARRVAAEEVIRAGELLGCRNEALKVMVSEKQTVVSKRPFFYDEAHYRQGVRLGRCQVAASSKNPLSRHKTLDWWGFSLALEAARKQGFFDSCWFNEKGLLTETSLANLFLVEKGRLVTPAVEEGLLPGIIRGWTMAAFPVQEEAIDEKRLLACEGAFLTNSLMGIMPVAAIGGRAIGRPPLVDAVMQRYNETIGGANGAD